MPNSPLLQYLESQGLSYEAQSMILFHKEQFDLPDTDWLFFYSQKGVENFMHQLQPTFDLDNYKFAFFGDRTASFAELQYGIKANFIGNSITEEVGLRFKETINNDTVTFVCGKLSLRSVQKFLENKIPQKEIIVYSQELRTDIRPMHYDIGVFTSPLNVKGFYENGGSVDMNIAIGTTTSISISPYHDKVITADDASEAGLVSALKAYLTTD